jgi:predicted DNA-binding protein
MRKVLITIYMDKEQLARLNILSAITRVPKAAYIREGIDIVLKKYEKQLKGRTIKRERR